jgi:hypothetical protein
MSLINEAGLHEYAKAWSAAINSDWSTKNGGVVSPPFTLHPKPVICQWQRNYDVRVGINTN